MKKLLSSSLTALLFAAVALLGASVLVGWHVESETLIQILPGLAPMQYNNALCFMLFGIAGLAWLYGFGKTSVSIASVGILLSGATLLQYVLNVDFGIDLFFFNTNEIIPTAHPGRMAPNSAIGHVLAFLSIILLYVNQAASVRASGILGVSVLAAGATSLIVYGVDTQAGFEWGRHTKMALHTSFGFVIGGLAIVLHVVPTLKRWVQKKKIESFRIWPYITVLLIAAFLIELQLPQDVATGLLYAVVISATWFGRNKKGILVVACVATFLVVADMFLSADSLGNAELTTHRLVTLISTWFAAVVIYYFKSGNEKLVQYQREISEKVQQLKEAEVRFRGIFDNTFQFIGLLQPDGTLIEANEAALSFGGVTIEQARGQKFWDSPWWSLNQDVNNQIRQAIKKAASGEFVRFDTVNLGADGTILNIDFSIRPVLDEDGKVVYLVPEGRDISERKKLEGKLKSNEKLLQQFVQNTPNAVAMFNTELEYVVASDTWYTDYGIEGMDIIGRHHYDVFPEIKKMPFWQELHKRALQGEVIRKERDSFEREDGSTSWLRYVIQPWKNENDEIGGIIMFTEDITERVELETKLAGSEKQFRTIFETIDEGIVYQNIKGEITNANAAAERILGISLEQMQGVKSIDPRWKSLREDGSDFPGEEHPAMVALKTGKEQRDVIQGIFHPGKEDYVWINANSYPVLDEETGQVQQVYSTFEDITVEYKAKKALEESEKRFNLAVQGTTAGVWDWISVDKDEEWWSPRFYELLGYKQGELNPSLDTFSELIHPEDKDLTFKMVDRHFKRKAPFIVEYRLRHKSGNYRWFLGSGQAIWDENDKPTRMVGTIVDIHSRKMAEIAEIEHALELKNKNKELQEFTYVASHDLQEPVRTISSFVELFREFYGDKLDDRANEFLDLMDTASKRSQKLIADLLEYSRIGRSGDVSEIDLNEVLNEILSDLSIRLKETHATIDIDKLPVIEGYRTELRLLFQNLISNAIKFSRPNTPPIVSISVIEHETEHEFIVKDNGIGINEKFFDQIFVVFKRLHGRSEFEGTGIGLAHCKKVVTLHQGKIWVNSKVDVGSEFHFTIPKKIDTAHFDKT